ncbi:GNAT family N-acetyltransferase [Celerinatantimonas diazotrophica]|uniref:RimJ/RimL family protein N-acetyltransferase n=1 Tax=Celerinatantimonas diazotrophica TaxID=412034 RepID=A0A4R1JM35_9GAMM|nr:GNAT family N-acetyltransferase [Celerinatantimonas diazotrophica]TCK52077.1 RimJ/RimL family protein N-acetyltransferase [Celerinatantimonas diazotrophica]CAG9296218.1 Acetyltransferase [Celerinatantimonas diazotrophica]
MQRNYFITSKRLGFSEWKRADFDLALGLWGDYNVTKFFDSTGQFTELRVRERLSQELVTKRKFGYQYWPIFKLTSGEHIGCAGLRPYDLDNKILEIGFHILPLQWRKGYAREAAQTIMSYAFNNLNIDALFAGHHPQNIGSRNLLKSLGFHYTHDEFYKPTGLKHPSYLFYLSDYLAIHHK